MSKAKTDGARAEEYVKEFATYTRIAADVEAPVETLINLLDTFHQHIFTESRMYLEQREDLKPYPLVNDWIDGILNEQQLPAKTDQDFKQALKGNLLDLCLATDVLVTVNNTKGESQLIAIDVTTNPNAIDTKLRVIQGKRKDGDPKKKFNPNKNVIPLRKKLGIDQHLILVVNPKNYPSYKTLLREIYAFANQPSRTGSVNLTDIPHEASRSHELANQDPKIMELLQISRAVKALLIDLGAGKRQPNGSYQFETKSYIFNQNGGITSLSAKDGRGEILRVSGENVTKDSLRPEDLKACKEIQKQVEQRLAKLPSRNRQRYPQFPQGRTPKRGPQR